MQHIWNRLSALLAAVLCASAAPTPNSARLSAQTQRQWERVLTTNTPPARWAHAMVYDENLNRTVIFGGDGTGFDRLNDLWALNGTTWIKLSTLNPPLPGRVNIEQAMVFDAKRNTAVLFGGLGASGYLSDTWVLGTGGWQQITPTLSPSARDAHSMVYDRQRKLTVLFGGAGELADTWEFDGESWTRRLLAGGPPGRFYHRMAYDEARGVIVLFGGRRMGTVDFESLNDTWEFDGAQWRRAKPTISPPGRWQFGMAYDTVLRKTVLYGGSNETTLTLSDTWQYDGATWERVAFDIPPGRTAPAMVYNRIGRRMLMFGGGVWPVTGTLTTFSDTWRLESPDKRIFAPITFNIWPETLTEREDNDTFATANLIASNSTYNGVTDDAYDVFSLDVSSAGNTVFQLTGLPAAADNNVQLQVYFNNDQTQVGTRFAAPYTLPLATQPGRYYVVVFTNKAAVPGSERYQLRASQ